ncbi:MAG: DUF1697 domain-containing protein [Candidatus Cloacimonetes bacterium]|nr:DUF1697 domain-containing protein [Candidatus Cloacimonadota bacterium]
MKYLCLIRGINVGGKNIIKMVDLKSLFEDLGFEKVTTYIQSGNVMFDSTNKNFREKIETALSMRLNDEIKTAIYTVSDIQNVIETKPVNFGFDKEKFKYDVIYMIPPLAPIEAEQHIKTKEGVDKLYIGKQVIYISRSIENLGQSKFPDILKTPIYKNITIRNWNTTLKLASLM